MLSLVDQSIEEYSISKSEPTPALLKEIVEVTKKSHPMPQMLCGPIEGRFLKLMVQISNAKRILEIGMFTGYSALSMAEGLPSDGELMTCEIDPDVIALAKGFFARSEHGKKIKVLEGPALESIKKVQGPLDLVFIDADKDNYPNYYEAVLPLVRTGGVIIIDNVLWSGRVLNPENDTDRTIASLNDKVAKDERVDRVMLPVRDGIFVIRKK